MARTFTVQVHEAEDGTLWAQVEELPGCFATGDDLDELKEALVEAIGMCLSEAERPVDAGAWIERPEKAWKVGTLTLTYA
jgi:predicted RNase H-like HicB family nuclease